MARWIALVVELGVRKVSSLAVCLLTNFIAVTLFPAKIHIATGGQTCGGQG